MDQKQPLYEPKLELSGNILYWNDTKGYGFIKVKGYKNNFFFHISTFAYHHRRPNRGDKVTFLAYQQNNEWQVTRVVLSEHLSSLYSKEAQDQQILQPHILEAIVYSFIVIFFYFILVLTSIPLALSSLIISLLTAFLYAIDKHAAIHNKQRVPEASMHIAAMLGGWPGALIARPLLRHKTTKIRFIIFFWLSIIIYFFTLYCIIIFAPEYLGFDLSRYFKIFRWL
ncbi:MAG: DNA-binding protein [Cardiobacteriales bacterium]|nr:MAG: DNA-binding protein [Cardiobacteriales bacterium]